MQNRKPITPNVLMSTIHRPTVRAVCIFRHLATLATKYSLIWGLGIVLFGLGSFSSVHADELGESLRKADELYHAYQLTSGRLDEAIGIYEQALTERGGDYHILWKLSDMHQNYGLTLGDDQKKKKIALWKKGIKYGSQAIEANPEGKEGHLYYMANLGTHARIRGVWAAIMKFPEIKKEMDRALELDPNYPEALVARGQFLREMPGIFGDKEEEVLQLYQRAIESNPRFIVVHFYLAEIDAEHKRYDDALDRLNKVIQCQDPWNQGHVALIVRPWVDDLLKEVKREKDKQ